MPAEGRRVHNNALSEDTFTVLRDGRINGNIYMHHVLILWYREYWTKRGSGDNFLVNYADDYIAEFENKWEAEKYYEQMQERLGKFGLELETGKSRLIEFGRYAKERRKRKGNGKPETFDFLGFTSYCGESRKGTSVVKAKTSGKKFRMKMKELKKWLRCRLTKPVRETMETMNRRSQKRSYNWEGCREMLKYYPLAYPKGYVNPYE
ncbi:MAG: hypothetical protein E7244_21085 [Enterocloster citroniae]|nr:hypothetical protein [Enterocloster citroniae]